MILQWQYDHLSVLTLFSNRNGSHSTVTLSTAFQLRLRHKWELRYIAVWGFSVLCCYQSALRAISRRSTPVYTCRSSPIFWLLTDQKHSPLRAICCNVTQLPNCDVLIADIPSSNTEGIMVTRSWQWLSWSLMCSRQSANGFSSDPRVHMSLLLTYTASKAHVRIFMWPARLYNTSSTLRIS
jgi:hypothetical protein